MTIRENAMRAVTLILASCLIAAAAGPSVAGSFREGPRQTAGQIACTRGGCVRVPRGCYGEMVYTWDGSPTGFERIVCPRRR